MVYVTQVCWQLASKYIFPIIKPTRCVNFTNLFLEWNTKCLGQFLCPSLGVFHCTHSNGIYHKGLLTACEQDQDGTSSILILLDSCMTYNIVVCTVENSWWWAEELSKTCTVSFQNKIEKLVHLVGFRIRNGPGSKPYTGQFHSL